MPNLQLAKRKIMVMPIEDETFFLKILNAFVLGISTSVLWFGVWRKIMDHVVDKTFIRSEVGKSKKEESLSSFRKEGEDLIIYHIHIWISSCRALAGNELALELAHFSSHFLTHSLS